MYVENPNSGVAKAKVIKHEVEVNTFLSKIAIRSVVLKKLNSCCIICLNQLIHIRCKATFLIGMNRVLESHKIANNRDGQKFEGEIVFEKSNDSLQKQFSIVFQPQKSTDVISPSLVPKVILIQPS